MAVSVLPIKSVLLPGRAGAPPLPICWHPAAREFACLHKPPQLASGLDRRMHGAAMSAIPGGRLSRGGGEEYSSSPARAYPSLPRAAGGE
jgi:hypothetical protein